MNCVMSKFVKNSPKRDAKLKSLQNKIFKRHFNFGIHSANLILRHSDNLQFTKLSAVEAQAAARCTVITLNTFRNDTNYICKLWYSLIVIQPSGNHSNPPRGYGVHWYSEDHATYCTV